MKSIQELRATLTEILHADGINLKLYLGVGDSDNRDYKLADFDDGATESVCQQFVGSVDHFFLDENLTTLPLSQMDHRADTLYKYDFDEVPSEFQKIRALLSGADPQLFSFENNALSRVTSLVIKISSAQKSVTFFKKFYPVSLVKRDQILLVVKSNTRFAVLDEDVFKVTGGFELILIDDEFYINDFGKFEKSFSFDRIAKNAMSQVAQKILALDMVNDLKGYLSAGVASRKDVLRAGGSRVLDLDKNVILAFAMQKHNQIGLRVVDGKLQLNSKD
ncbi:hypothetical protein B9Z45_14485 [Limnohabitans sp. 2KL-17]|uniref:anti-phage protein KwaB n=1 Tax=Limnohabitans sp. 2KL-17 TaxID=1100704 RepID=UPI000D3962D2|nr:anti-phage protein KwaB [Limnohabitans sp. 2KL-17]PUE51449.1 hypothetical protein B9Z45_14485 [Limnohabitans sp. 2KL-17]